jgi:hypothetical protein
VRMGRGRGRGRDHGIVNALFHAFDSENSFR